MARWIYVSNVTCLSNKKEVHKLIQISPAHISRGCSIDLPARALAVVVTYMKPTM